MRQFHEQLQDLFKTVVSMGNLAEEMIRLAVRSLVVRDESLQERVFAAEQEVNALQVKVDEQAVRLTILQQPVARDARFLFMASRIGGELERVADHAINISLSARHVIEAPPLRPQGGLIELPIMADVAQKMVRDSLSAMINRDIAMAQAVLEDEKKVDAFRNKIFQMLLEWMKQDGTTVDRAMSLILIARNLERIGDHATNIAEEIIYWIQGRDVRHSKSKAVV
jgi:phosphate transport system protein